MMITCKEFARMASRRLDQRLPLWMRMKMGLHLCLCRACARYNKQLTLLQRIMQMVAAGFDDIEFDETLKLSALARQKIRDSIGS